MEEPALSWKFASHCHSDGYMQLHRRLMRVQDRGQLRHNGSLDHRHEVALVRRKGRARVGAEGSE